MLAPTRAIEPWTIEKVIAAGRYARYAIEPREP
ncbi:MAG: hypothetical protein JWN00_4074, partial [Actinomycetia bacterium]|nr:hypothetical protein [Actinomycetes bacterium]